MAVRFLNGEVSDLCLGKPELTCVTATASVADALSALKTCGETHVSVWACCAGGDNTDVCFGKICVADVILYLCRKENLTDPFRALEAPVSDALPKGSCVVRHLEPNSSLLEAIDYILEGTQNLVIPIQNHQWRKFIHKKDDDRKYCWLTREDITRYFMNSIRAFTPVPNFTIDSLNVIDRDIMTVHYKDPASSALEYFNRSVTEQTSVAVVDDDNRFLGEISPCSLTCADETVAAAIMALSAGELMTYIDCPTDDLVQMVKQKLEEKKLMGMLELIDDSNHSSVSSSCSSCSSDEEYGLGRNGRTRSFGSNRNYPARRSEAVVCSPRSTLMAVMIQALAHRVSCVWVVEEDHTLVGTVTFAGMLSVFRSVAGGGMHNKQETDR